MFTIKACLLCLWMINFQIIDYSALHLHINCQHLLLNYWHTVWNYIVSVIVAKPSSEKIMLFSSHFSVSLPMLNLFPLLVPQERLLKLFIYREEEVEGQDILFSVRFVKIILIMILLATGRMWLLKMDLWKNSSPQKNIGQWMNPPPTP